MNKSIIFVLLVSLVILSKAQSEAEVEYYVRLINERSNQPNNSFINASYYIPNSDYVSDFGMFDYIVIGAGAAGSVIASRLSEKKKYKILLIEAGGQEDDFTDIPTVSTYVLNSQYGWNLYTKPQANTCLAMVNDQCQYFTGRGLGGSTILNTLRYVRGSKVNYDDWEKQGNSGWSYKDVLPLFLKSENASFNFTDPKYHRRGGYLNVEYASSHRHLYYSFVKANIERGQRFVDYNGAQMIGVGETQYNAMRGRRVSSNKAFLRPAYNRTNLKIMTYSYVTKINIDKFTKEAYGVTFSHNKKLYLARARREIILSAGIFQSPQLLMLSGVGPAQELKDRGIPVIESLSVGLNFHCHYGLSLSFTSNLSTPNVSLEQGVRDYLQGFGELTLPYYFESLSWLETGLQNRSNFPDIELTYIGDGAFSELRILRGNYDNETMNSVFATIGNNSNIFALVVIIVQPKSRGRVELNSSSPYDFPLIDQNAFSDFQQLDLETMYRGMKRALDLANTEAFKKINATVIPNQSHPRCREYEIYTREYWYCQIRYIARPSFNPAGTCKMGADPIFGGAVVDHNLKVHGIKKLRVADASIIPTPISGHYTAAAMMIGEKVSKLILNT